MLRSQRQAVLEETIYNLEFWKFVSIPFIAAFVGWATNWVAVKMTFLPLEFFGVRPIGWQGIIPSKVVKMSTIFVDQTMDRLGRLSELFEQMDPERISAHILEFVEPRVDEYIDEIMLKENRVLWENLPQAVKEQAYARGRAQLPNHVAQLVSEVGEKIEDLVDLKHMLITQLEADKSLLNRLFLESGAREFKFIVRSGLYFGFLFGLVQLGVWYLHQGWWVLPAFGLLVGYATNWIAINLIFRPLNPMRVGPWKVQGLFLRRQNEVAGIWCDLVTAEILTLPNIIRSMLTGPKSDRAKAMIKRHIKPTVDESMGMVKTLAQVAVGVEGYAQIKESVGQKAIDVSTEPFHDQLFNQERGQVIARLLRERMEAMPPAQFQDLLRPCFQEDELKLILLGAALGFGAGLAQLVLVFGNVDYAAWWQRLSAIFS